jgi:predicted nucleic acid-binding protein
VIVVDTGPLVSLMNREEAGLHRFAALVIRDDSSSLIVPWPVYTEADLLLRRSGFRAEALVLGQALVTGELRLEAPGTVEFELGLRLLDRYASIGLDLPDAVVIAMAWSRSATAFTWDFRHFRAVVVERGLPVPLTVQEHQVRGRR